MLKRKQPAVRPIPAMLFVALSFAFSPCASAQSVHSLDSLASVVSKATGKDKANNLYELVYAYLRSDIKKADSFFNVVKSERQKPQTPEAIAYLDLTKGIYESRTGSIDSAIKHLLNAQKFAKQVNDDYALVRIDAALGYAFISAGKPKKALENMFDGLRLTAKLNDKEMEYKLRTNVVWAYLELKEYRACIDYGLANLRLMEGSDFGWIALYSYNNIAIAYGAIGKLDSANYYVHKGLAAAEKSNDIQSLANGHFILGTIYANANKYDLAIQQYLEAKPYRQKIGNPFFIVSDLYTMSQLYEKMEKYREGIAAASEALDLAKQYNLLLKFEGTYESLAKNYEGIADFKNASKFYKLWATAKDSVYQNANTTAIAEMQTRFETEKKEQSISVQRARLARQQAELNLTYVVIAALTITLISTVVIFLLVRSRHRRKRELALRSAQIDAAIQSQENERRRFARDLHDGMGQIISALRLTLHALTRTSTTEERIQAMEKSEVLLNEMHHEIRSIAFNLMPQTLIQHGLTPALKEMASRVSNTPISIRINALDFPSRMPEIYEICLYRIVQEWINNIIKYSDATSIDVQLIGHDTELTVMIEDNGSGFDTSRLTQSQGNGWRNINSRISLIKGYVEINSTPLKKGSVLAVTIPFEGDMPMPQVTLAETE